MNKRWLGLLWLAGLVLVLSGTRASHADEEVGQQGYPDVWYRLYEWPVHVCDKFLSDKEIWGDEPVLILCNGNQREAVAEGFFSQKRHEVVREAQRVPNGAKTGFYRKWRYRYKQNEKVMEKRYLVPVQNTGWTLVAFHDGRRIEFSEHSEMSWGIYTSSDELMKMGTESANILQERNESISVERRGIGALMDFACEPLRYSLRLLSPSGQVLWDKLAVRYYNEGEAPPPHHDGNGICGGFEAWLSEGAQRDPLLLADRTLLVDNYPSTFVIRLRLEDGGSGALPPKLRVLDRDAVNRAKQEMVKRYLDEMMKVPPAGRMAGLDVVERLYGSEGLYRVLARYFFEEQGDKGDKK